MLKYVHEINILEGFEIRNKCMWILIVASCPTNTPRTLKLRKTTSRYLFSTFSCGMEWIKHQRSWTCPEAGCSTGRLSRPALCLWEVILSCLSEEGQRKALFLLYLHPNNTHEVTLSQCHLDPQRDSPFLFLFGSFISSLSLALKLYYDISCFDYSLTGLQVVI